MGMLLGRCCWLCSLCLYVHKPAPFWLFLLISKNHIFTVFSSIGLIIQPVEFHAHRSLGNAPTASHLTLSLQKKEHNLLIKTPDAPNYSSHMATKYLHSARLWLWYVDVTDIRILSTCVPRIQRAWRASTSRRGSWQGQDKNLTSHRRGETVASESLQDPVMTTNISPVRPHEENQTDNHMVQRENERHL